MNHESYKEHIKKRGDVTADSPFKQLLREIAETDHYEDVRPSPKTEKKEEKPEHTKDDIA